MADKLVEKDNSQIQHRALKLRIYPSKEQEILINKTFGCVRKRYSIYLDENKQFYEKVIKPEENLEKRKELWKALHLSTEKELREQFPYMKEVSAQMDAKKAFSNFFNSLSGKRKGGKAGFPKFKPRHKHNYSYKECMPMPDALNLGNKTVGIPKLSEVKYRNGKIDTFFKGGTLKSITVRKNPAGEYYASLLFERGYVRKPKTYSGGESKAVGFDFSPAELYIDSSGNSGRDFGYVPQKQKFARKLKILKRRPAKKQKGSNNREKAGIKAARVENRIGNTRLDFIEKKTLRLVRNYEIIGVENLNLQGISGFLRNVKNTVDASWGTFARKLEWKASKNEHNCQVINVSRHFPSSQLCSKCGFQNKKLKLSDRKWVCPSCETEHNRDFNAAANIKGESIRPARPEFRHLESSTGMNRYFPGITRNPVKQETGVAQGV